MRTLVSLSLAALTLIGATALNASPASACDERRVVRVVSEPRVVRLADDTVLGRATDVYRVRLMEGDRIRLAAKSTGLLALQVFDACGRLVADDEDDRLTLVEFTPRHAGVFTVKLVNLERCDVDYVLTAR